MTEAALRRAGSADGGEADEVDDRFRALLEALRTTMPGVQVLFGFLLVLPFQTPFVETSDLAHAAFAVAFYAAAAAAVLLAAPGVHQWVRAPKSGIRRRHESHVLFAVRLALVGSACFLLALIAAVFMVSMVVFGRPIAAAALAVAAGTAGWAWYYLPLVRFDRQ